MEHRRRQFLKQASIVGAISTAGCTQFTGGGSSNITIGFNAPLTGFASADGKSAERGARLAEKQINADGGINGNDVEVLIQDGAGVSDEAVPVAKDFINSENVDFGVSGSYSTATRAVSSVYDQAGVPFVSAYATHPEITQGEYTFRMGIWAPLHGKVGAYVADQHLDSNTAAILSVNNDFGQTVGEQFKDSANERGIDIAYETRFELGASDFRSALNSVKDEGVDVLHVTGYYSGVSNLVKQAVDIGLEAQIVSDEGVDSPKFFDLAGDATNGTIITTNLNRGSDHKATSSFLSGFGSEYGVQASMVAASCYDAVKLCAKAATEAGGTDPSEITSAINNLTNWNGAATGPIQEFMGPGEPVRPIAVQQVQDQEWTEYELVTDQELITPEV